MALYIVIKFCCNRSSRKLSELQDYSVTTVGVRPYNNMDVTFAGAFFLCFRCSFFFTTNGADVYLVRLFLAMVTQFMIKRSSSSFRRRTGRALTKLRPIWLQSFCWCQSRGSFWFLLPISQKLPTPPPLTTGFQRILVYEDTRLRQSVVQPYPPFFISKHNLLLKYSFALILHYVFYWAVFVAGSMVGGAWWKFVETPLPLNRQNLQKRKR